jgi:hypothetical protein
VLACQGGTWVEAHCHGPGGCSKLGSKITCDDEVAEEGDACLMVQSENKSCSVDKKKELVCEDGKFKELRWCHGPKGCTPKGDAPTCDATQANKDEACTTPGANACAVDLKSRLICKDGKWAFDRYCHGATGCHLKDLSCDEQISDVGDPCGVSGYQACSADERFELVCQGGQFVKSRECKKAGCHVMAGGHVSCQ